MTMLPNRLSKSISNQKLRLLFIALFYVLMLVPTQYPKFAGTPFFFLYVLAVAISLIILCSSFVAVLIFAAIATVRRKSMSDRLYSFSLSVITSAIVVVMMIVLARFLPREFPTGSDLLTFDSKTWISDNGNNLDDHLMTPRQKMLRSTIEEYVQNRTREQVLSALGRPTDTHYFKASGRDFIYYLGPERDSFLGIDSEWLLIWFNEDGKVRKYQITVD